MKTIREAALELCDRWDTPLWKNVEHTAVFVHELRVALARPEQEPVAWLTEAAWGTSVDLEKPDFGKAEWKAPSPKVTALYATPPNIEWVELTDDERQQALDAHPTALGVAYAIESKLKVKNA